MPSFAVGALSGVGIVIVLLAGVAVAMKHPVPHMYKQISDKQATPSGLYMSLGVAGGSDISGVNPFGPLSVTEAKQVADVIGASAFQLGSDGTTILFMKEKPADTNVVAATGKSYFVRYY